MAESIQVFYSGALTEQQHMIHHKYIVYTDNSGKQYYARGGPNGIDPGEFGGILGFIKTEHGAYIDGGTDWDRNENDHRETITVGGNLSGEWSKIRKAMDDINYENHLYQPALQNSNSAVDTALHRAGLPEPKLDDEKFSPASGVILPTSAANDNNEGDEDNEGNEGNEGGKGGGGSSSGNEGGGSSGGKGGGSSSNEDNDSGSGGGGSSSGKPIVVDLDGDGIETVSKEDSTAKFDFDEDGYREKTAWVGKDDGLLVFDIGNDGKVTEAKEIAFAYWTEDENDTDLEGLRTTFDSNRDGFLDELDADWAQFRIWQDKNQDGVADEGEFLTLEEAGIKSIDLSHKEGTAEVAEDGTVNHGLIDIEKTDGSTTDGGDVAFAFDNLGEREIVDENGETVIEYEGDTFEIADANEGFTATDYNALIARIQYMGFTESAADAMNYAVQNGEDVVFQFDGDSVLTVENVTLEELSSGLNDDVA